MRNGYEHMKVTAFIAMFPELLTVLQFERKNLFYLLRGENKKKRIQTSGSLFFTARESREIKVPTLFNLKSSLPHDSEHFPVSKSVHQLPTVYRALTCFTKQR